MIDKKISDRFPKLCSIIQNMFEKYLLENTNKN